MRTDRIVLATSGLVAGYEPDLPIVRGIDFEVHAGELVVVLGPNGAGKSTFVKAIAGLVPIHAGTVMLGDADVDQPAGRGENSPWPRLRAADGKRLRHAVDR